MMSFQLKISDEPMTVTVSGLVLAKLVRLGSKWIDLWIVDGGVDVDETRTFQIPVGGRISPGIAMLPNTVSQYLYRHSPPSIRTSIQVSRISTRMYL